MLTDHRKEERTGWIVKSTCSGAKQREHCCLECSGRRNLTSPSRKTTKTLRSPKQTGNIQAAHFRPHGDAHIFLTTKAFCWRASWKGPDVDTDAHRWEVTLNRVYIDPLGAGDSARFRLVRSVLLYICARAHATTIVEDVLAQKSVRLSAPLDVTIVWPLRGATVLLRHH